jgi:predicted transcriptional regulator
MRDGRHGGIAKAKAACAYKGLNRRGQGAGVEEIAVALKIGRASVYRVLNTA